MMEAVCFSETSVSIFQTAWCSIPEDSHLDAHRRENLKSHLVKRTPDGWSVIALFITLQNVMKTSQLIGTILMSVLDQRTCRYTQLACQVLKEISDLQLWMNKTKTGLLKFHFVLKQGSVSM
jgi:hypothetical protein